MKMTKLLSVVAVAVAMSACASPDGLGKRMEEKAQYVDVRVVDQPVALNRTQSEVDPHEILCKRIPITGSRIKRPVCLTRAEWEAARRKSEEMYRQIIQQL